MGGQTIVQANSNYWAIVPAAGIGYRMQAKQAKQYLMLQDKTVLETSLEKLLSCSKISKIILVLAEHDQIWQHSCYYQHPKIITVEGGDERFLSVFNGLKYLKQHLAQAHDWVLVHDAARPCVRVDDINQLIQQLANSETGGLLGFPVTDTLKTVVDKQVMATLDRRQLWRAFTPQMFRFEKLYQATEFVIKQQLAITDDASAIEAMGWSVAMVLGHADNIKITYPEDLALARFYLQSL